MFGYSGLSVNSDLPCMFCFNNKIFIVMPKKKKKIVEYMGQGVCADYGVFCVLLDSCGDSKSLQVGKSVNGFLKCSLSIWSDLAPLLCINPLGFKLRGLSSFF